MNSLTLISLNQNLLLSIGNICLIISIVIERALTDSSKQYAQGNNQQSKGGTDK